jgi:hypothetical protein
VHEVSLEALVFVALGEQLVELGQSSAHGGRRLRERLRDTLGLRSISKTLMMLSPRWWSLVTVLVLGGYAYLAADANRWQYAAVAEAIDRRATDSEHVCGLTGR